MITILLLFAAICRSQAMAGAGQEVERKTLGAKAASGRRQGSGEASDTAHGAGGAAHGGIWRPEWPLRTLSGCGWNHWMGLTGGRAALPTGYLLSIPPGS